MSKIDGVLKDLLLTYNAKKSRIKKRLRDFKRNLSKSNKDLFAQLCFCLCTPQSKALRCDEAVCRLTKSGILFTGCARKIAKNIKGFVRFHNKKAKYITGARKIFSDAFGRLNLKEKIRSFKDEKKLRQWLVQNLKGFSLKEASHFLRNIGLGDDLAIIDRHVLINLKKCGLINHIPQNVSNKQYILMEDKMRLFSKKIGIPLAELDLLFWSNQTGYIFK